MVSVSAPNYQNQVHKQSILYPALGGLALTGSGYMIGQHFDNKNKKLEQVRFKEEQDKFDKIYSDKKQELQTKIDALNSQVTESNKAYDAKHKELTTKLGNLNKQTFSQKALDLRNNILQSFPDRVYFFENNGKMRDKIPECILVTGKNKESADLLINWLKTRLQYTTNTTITIGNAEDESLWNKIENFRENIANKNGTSKWQFLHINDLEEVIRDDPTGYSTISSVRNMNTTLVFYAEEYEKLDYSVKQPNRIDLIYAVDSLNAGRPTSDTINLTNNEEMNRLFKKETEEMQAKIKLRELKRDPGNEELAKLKKELKEIKCGEALPVKLTKNAWKGLGVGIILSVLGIVAFKYNNRLNGEKENDKTN